MKCSLCNKKSDFLEKHHIIPKSKGGLDTNDNLINICGECHSKIHDVSFSRSLIKPSLDKKLGDLEQGMLWIKVPANENLVYERLMKVYDDQGPEKHNYIVTLIENDSINCFDLMNWIEKGYLNIKKNMKRTILL